MTNLLLLLLFLVILSILTSVSAFIFSTHLNPRTSVRNIGISHNVKLSLSKGFGKKEEDKEPKKKQKETEKRRDDLFSKLNPKIVTSTDGEKTSKYSNPQIGDFQVFDSLVSYPTDFQLKVIGDGKDGFVEDMVKIGAEATNMRPEMVPHTTRQQGKWTSVTLNLYVTSADQLYKCYEEIDKDSRVKFKF